MDLKKMLTRQRTFSDLFYDSNVLTEAERIEKHKTLCLAMHSELSQLADSVHYREHRPGVSPTREQNILFETIDIYRYCLSVLNLWGFSAEEAVSAFESRDAHLHSRAQKNIGCWDGRPMVVVDVDDVLARFRQNFYSWVNERYDVLLDPMSESYYFGQTVGGKSGDQILSEFINEGNLRTLDVCENVRLGLKRLRAAGYWIHILTARPVEELKCLYETHDWLTNHVREFDSAAFHSEKYLWLAATRPYLEGKVVCAIDDSPKHAAEFAQHGVKTLLPKFTYNKSVWENNNIVPFDWENDDIKTIIDRIAAGG